MPILHYETSVPESGTIVLPQEFRGGKIVVMKEAPFENNLWGTKKSLDELVQEQGVGPCTDPDLTFGSLSFLWDSKEEAEEFLRRRKES